jgi:hypothetical protein
MKKNTAKRKKRNFVVVTRLPPLIALPSWSLRPVDAEFRRYGDSQPTTQLNWNAYDGAEHVATFKRKSLGKAFVAAMNCLGGVS